ncbi:MAG: regulatory protein GemA [Desulfitobacteriaceae bacterium]|nr:regulatory protein GemA [Desulfitobacteriaceae bacterium]
MEKVNKAQIAKIWAMAKENGLDSDLLHEFVANVTGSKSISALTKQQAMKVIDAMKSKNKPKAKSENRVSKEQLWKINQLAKELGWDNNPKRLQGYIKKYGGVERSEWLTPAKAWRIIEGLKKQVERVAQNVSNGV